VKTSRIGTSRSVQPAAEEDTTDRPKRLEGDKHASWRKTTGINTQNSFQNLGRSCSLCPGGSEAFTSSIKGEGNVNRRRETEIGRSSFSTKLNFNRNAERDNGGPEAKRMTNRETNALDAKTRPGKKRENRTLQRQDLDVGRNMGTGGGNGTPGYVGDVM